MDHTLVINISTLGLLLILSIIILCNSIKIKNKLVIYLTIATIIISLGSLIYFLIEHFNKQHHANNNVTLSDRKVVSGSAGGLKEWNTDQDVGEESVLDADAAALKKKAEQEDICVPIGHGENCW